MVRQDGGRNCISIQHSDAGSLEARKAIQDQQVIIGQKKKLWGNLKRRLKKQKRGSKLRLLLICSSYMLSIRTQTQSIT